MPYVTASEERSSRLMLDMGAAGWACLFGSNVGGVGAGVERLNSLNFFVRDDQMLLTRADQVEAVSSEMERDLAVRLEVEMAAAANRGADLNQGRGHLVCRWAEERQGT